MGVCLGLQLLAIALGGEVGLARAAEVGFRVTGKVAKRLVEVGDTVEVGQKLALLDQTDLKLQAEQAEAENARLRETLEGRIEDVRLLSAAVAESNEREERAERRNDDLIHRLAARNSRWWVRGRYELLFLAYLGFVLYRVGKNFFYDSFINEKNLLSTDFYLPALIFGVLWTGVLLILFLGRLRRGLGLVAYG